MPSLFPEPAGPDWITAHCDGGARGNPGPAGYGAVLTDAHGRVLAELSEFLGIRSNNVAEYSGLLACLQWALENHHPRLRVISDSELMVKQIQGKYKVKSPDLLPLWQEARRRIDRLDRFEIAHALRHKNKDADRLANQAMDSGMGKSPKSPNPATNQVPQGFSLGSHTAAKSGGASAPAKPSLRGISRNNTIHLLGNATLPDGVFVKILPE